MVFYLTIITTCIRNRRLYLQQEHWGNLKQAYPIITTCVRTRRLNKTNTNKHHCHSSCSRPFQSVPRLCQKKSWMKLSASCDAQDGRSYRKVKRKTLLEFSVLVLIFTSRLFSQSVFFCILIGGAGGYCCTWSSQSYTHRVGLLWARDRTVAEISDNTQQYRLDSNP